MQVICEDVHLDCLLFFSFRLLCAEGLHLGLVLVFRHLVILEQLMEALSDRARHLLVKVDHENKRGQHREEGAADEGDQGNEPWPSVEGRVLLLGHLTGGRQVMIVNSNSSPKGGRENVTVDAFVDPADSVLDGAKLSSNVEEVLLLFCQPVAGGLLLPLHVVVLQGLEPGDVGLPRLLLLHRQGVVVVLGLLKGESVLIFARCSVVILRVEGRHVER